MKKSFYLVALALLLYGTSFAQETPLKRTVEYCDVLIVERTFSNKVAIAVDFGQERKQLTDLVKDASGKPLLFNSPIDALHHLAEQGWELVESYLDPNVKVDNRHYILKRKASI